MVCSTVSVISVLCLVTVSAVVLIDMRASVKDNRDYLKRRSEIVRREKRMFSGGSTDLTQKEIAANVIVSKKKLEELAKSHENISNFLPAAHFFQAKAAIDKSQVFSILKKIPKGASLHTHMTAAVNVDYILNNITYRDNIYGCEINGVFKLRFLKSPNDDSQHSWKSLVDYRAEDPDFDVWLRERLSLEVKNPHTAYPSAQAIWQRFKKIFTTEYDMLSFRPVFEDYIYQLLLELHQDNVFYTELRGTIMPLYELDGTVYSNEQFFQTFIKTVENFRKQHPDFQGVRYIHSIYRGVAPEVLRAGLDELINLKRKFPDFIAGFDFVGYEEEGNQLVYYHDILLEASKDLKFFFHAGETNWFGYNDLNLVDAMLLNSSRIGHGFGLMKHPILVEMARQQDIAIELCPISNQVLMLNSDHRNHPVVPLLATDFPVVICNDDPAVWGATGLSYDWYMVFMAMTPENAGIEVLKQFAVNSIKYSAMEEHQKVEAMKEWEKRWHIFLEYLNK